MLYDQAQLVLAFLEAAQVSGDRFYASIADDTLRYVLRDMAGEAGGFYSAEDADSVPAERAAEPGAHAAEGAFYLWTADDIAAETGTDAEIVGLRFGLEPEGMRRLIPVESFQERTSCTSRAPSRTSRSTPEGLRRKLPRCLRAPASGCSRRVEGALGLDSTTRS